MFGWILFLSMLASAIAGIGVGWCLRNDTKVGTPSTSTNNARAKCTACGKEVEKLYCRRCASPIA